MSRLHLLVAGSREATEPEVRSLVRRDAGTLLARHGRLAVMEGGCPTGADAFIREWANERIARGDDVTLETYEAPFKNRTLGGSAGPARYGYMIGRLHERGVPVLVRAYLRPNSRGRGTAGTAAFARHVGLYVEMRDV